MTITASKMNAIAWTGRIDEVIEKLDRLRSQFFELQRKVDYDCASDRDLSNLRSEFNSLERTVQSLEHRGRW